MIIPPKMNIGMYMLKISMILYMLNKLFALGHPEVAPAAIPEEISNVFTHSLEGVPVAGLFFAARDSDHSKPDSEGEVQ